MQQRYRINRQGGETCSKRRCVRLRCVTLTLVLAGMAMMVRPAWAVDPGLQEAQHALSRLGYEIGMADGVYGPRTRQALEAFQRQQHLPVTGILDATTLRALDKATAPPPEAIPRVMPVEDAPLRAVVTYLRFYAFQPARVLPYVTEQFRGGLSPREWLEQTLKTLAAEDYIYLEWKVQHITLADTQATVEVYTRVRTQQQEHRRQEVFTLQRMTDGTWLINAWRIEALPPATTTFKVGS